LHIVVHQLDERGVRQTKLVFEVVEDRVEAARGFTGIGSRRGLYDPCGALVRTVVRKDSLTVENAQFVVMLNIEAQRLVSAGS